MRGLCKHDKVLQLLAVQADFFAAAGKVAARSLDSQRIATITSQTIKVTTMLKA